jgi:hypothetical protein
MFLVGINHTFLLDLSIQHLYSIQCKLWLLLTFLVMNRLSWPNNLHMFLLHLRMACYIYLLQSTLLEECLMPSTLFQIEDLHRDILVLML